MAQEVPEKNLYRAEERKAHEHVRTRWEADAEFILGKKGAQFVKTHAIRTSNHEFTVFMTLLTDMGALTNGGTMGIFPGNWSPLNQVGVLVGRSQTRKSQMTGLTREIATTVDAYVRELAESRLDAEENAERQKKKLKMTSVSLSSFTPAAFFERCSGDFAPVQNPEDFKESTGLNNPLFQGRVANIDEVYQFFADLGLVSADTTKKKGTPGASSAVNEHAGVFNRYIQFGDCARATKTAGNHGDGGNVSVTTLSAIGNMHTTMAIPMDRGETGMSWWEGVGG